MRSGTIAFLLGVLWLQQFAALPSLHLAWLLFLFVPAIVFFSYPWCLPFCFAAGFLWALWVAHQILSPGIVPQLEGKDMQLEGRVASLPVVYENSMRFEFDVDRSEYQGKTVTSPGRIRLSWYGRFPEMHPGEPWRLTVRLKQPHGFQNPGGFDYEGWLYQRRIRATGYVRKAVTNRSLGPAYGYPVQRWRMRLKQRLLPLLGESPSSSLLLALIIGDRSAITPEQWETLQQTGTTHLMAISGLHIGLVAGLAYLLGRFLWRFTGRGMLWLPAPKAGALLALLAATAYAALAGFAIPTQRALIMVAVTMLALFTNRFVSPGRVLALALLLVLLFDPLAVLAAGFWLSFAAVAVIFYGLGGHLGRLSRWQQGLKIQWWISVGLFPLVLMLFQKASLVAPLANFVAVPLVGLLVVPLALSGSVLLPVFPDFAAGLLSLAVWLMDQLENGLNLLSQWPFASWSGVVSNAWVGLLALIGVLLVLAPRGWPGRWPGMILLLPLLFTLPPVPDAGTARFTLLDVGQGLSAVVQTRHHALVFDTGPRFSPRFDTGRAVVLPYLRQMGIRRIDRLIFSHGDRDHIGGATSVLANMKVGEILSSVADKFSTYAARDCKRGESWEWDGVRFDILHPATEAESKRNDASCVLKITAGDEAVLLPGDIEKAAERRLVKRQAQTLAAEILVAPHHGSNTSSTPAFIDAVSPRYVLFPVGYRNRYHFPRPEVMARYRSRHITALQTDATGAIGFLLGAGKLAPHRYRQEKRRYWQYP